MTPLTPLASRSSIRFGAFVPCPCRLRHRLREQPAAPSRSEQQASTPLQWCPSDCSSLGFPFSSVSSFARRPVNVDELSAAAQRLSCQLAASAHVLTSPTPRICQL